VDGGTTVAGFSCSEPQPSAVMAQTAICWSNERNLLDERIALPNVAKERWMKATECVLIGTQPSSLP
jgi:hypothetical protein